MEGGKLRFIFVSRSTPMIYYANNIWTIYKWSFDICYYIYQFLFTYLKEIGNYYTNHPPYITDLTVRVLTFIDISTSSGKGGMATFTLNRLHSLCRTAHCRAFFGGFIHRAQFSTLESVRNNEQCKLEFLGGDNNGTK